jgi:hypothetical protein
MGLYEGFGGNPGKYTDPWGDFRWDEKQAGTTEKLNKFMKELLQNAEAEWKNNKNLQFWFNDIQGASSAGLGDFWQTGKGPNIVLREIGDAVTLASTPDGEILINQAEWKAAAERFGSLSSEDQRKWIRFFTQILFHEAVHWISKTRFQNLLKYWPPDAWVLEKDIKEFNEKWGGKYSLTENWAVATKESTAELDQAQQKTKAAVDKYRYERLKRIIGKGYNDEGIIMELFVWGVAHNPKVICPPKYRDLYNRVVDEAGNVLEK